MEILEKNSFVEADVVLEVLVRMREGTALSFLVVFKLPIVLVLIVEIRQQVEDQRLLVLSLEVSVLEHLNLNWFRLVSFRK